MNVKPGADSQRKPENLALFWLQEVHYTKACSESGVFFDTYSFSRCSTKLLNEDNLRTAALTSHRLTTASRIILAGILLGFFAVSAGAQSRKPRYSVDKKGIGPAFSVVEFFSSENCLFCRDLPSLVRELESDALMNGKRVFPLVYHIDYLSYPSWKDIYANERYSERQKKYSKTLGVRRVVPGHVFINGTWDMDYRKVASVKTYAKLALASPAKVVIAQKSLMNPNGSSVKIAFAIQGLKKTRRPYTLFTAVLSESGVIRSITEGPNNEQVFRHYGLVRAMESVRFGEDGRGEVEIVFPDGLKKERAAVTLLVQEPDSMKLLGAERIFLADLKAQSTKPRSSVPAQPRNY